MKKNFKLEKVLKFREDVLELEKKKLTELQMQLKDLEIKREGFVSELAEKNTELESVKEKADFRFIKMYEDFISKLKFMLMQMNNMVSKAKMDVEVQKKKVVDALNDKKVMEKLKDKHIENYQMYLNKEEMKLVDDMVTKRYQGGQNED